MAYTTTTGTIRVDDRRLNVRRSLARIADQASRSGWGVLAAVVAGLLLAGALLFMTDVADAKPGTDRVFIGALMTAAFLIVQLVVGSRSDRQSMQFELSRAENLNWCDLSSQDLSRTYLRNKEMHNVKLSEVMAFHADFEGALLTEARLTRGVFRGASFRNAHLAKSSCFEADLRDANFAGCRARKVNLRRADLRNSILDGADLRKARLQGADLRGCDLSTATLTRARFDRRTRFPAGFMPTVHGLIEVPEEHGGPLWRLPIVIAPRRPRVALVAVTGVISVATLALVSMMDDVPSVDNASPTVASTPEDPLVLAEVERAPELLIEAPEGAIAVIDFGEGAHIDLSINGTMRPLLGAASGNRITVTVTPTNGSAASCAFEIDGVRVSESTSSGGPAICTRQM